MIRFENGSVLVTNDPVITYDHISDHPMTTKKRAGKASLQKAASLTQIIFETLLMLALFTLCAWMGFHG